MVRFSFIMAEQSHLNVPSLSKSSSESGSMARRELDHREITAVNTGSTYTVEEVVRILSSAEVLQTRAHEGDIERIVQSELGVSADARLDDSHLAELANKIGVDLQYVQQARRINFPTVEEQFEDLKKYGATIDRRMIQQKLEQTYIETLGQILFQLKVSLGESVHYKKTSFQDNMFISDDYVTRILLYEEISHSKTFLGIHYQKRGIRKIAEYVISSGDSWVDSIYYTPSALAVLGEEVTQFNTKFSAFALKNLCHFKFRQEVRYIPGV